MYIATYEYKLFMNTNYDIVVDAFVTNKLCGKSILNISITELIV